MKHPKISVVVVTHNSEVYIRQCLDALLRVTYQPIDTYVIDNASTDNTTRILNTYKHIHATYLTKNIGFAEANNLAMNNIHGEYVCLLNPDTVVEKSFFEPLLAEMEKNPRVGACQPIVHLLKDKNVINLTGKKTHFLGFDWIAGYKTTRVPRQQEITSFSGSGVLLRSSTLRDVGFFDASYFMYYEDSDLAWRMRMRGWSIMFIPQSKMFHDYKYMPEKGGLHFSEKIFFNERNRLMNVLKNYSLWTLMLIFPVFLGTELGLLMIALLQGWFRAKIRSYFSLFIMLPSILKKRSLVQKQRTVQDRDITEGFETAITFEKFQHPLVRYIANPILKWYWGIIRHII
ncbi:MAG TPA: glycosyltransferase family 2 protein [Patescibacteria group bacterium]|nr:glycosyltransferase family 2 protein [Patescibacteria group bacterium]